MGLEERLLAGFRLEAKRLLSRGRCDRQVGCLGRSTDVSWFLYVFGNLRTRIVQSDVGFLAPVSRRQGGEVLVPPVGHR